MFVLCPEVILTTLSNATETLDQSAQSLPSTLQHLQTFMATGTKVLRSRTNTQVLRGFTEGHVEWSVWERVRWVRLCTHGQNSLGLAVGGVGALWRGRRKQGRAVGSSGGRRGSESSIIQPRGRHSQSGHSWELRRTLDEHRLEY